MTEKTLETALHILLEMIAAYDDENAGDFEEEMRPFRDCAVDTYERAGILTNNRGLVVRMTDGSEFQVTIVQSRASRERDEDDESDAERDVTGRCARCQCHDCICDQ